MKRLFISLLLLMALAGTTLVFLFSGTAAGPADDADTASRYRAGAQASPNSHHMRTADRAEDKAELLRIIRPSGEE